jgi:hypothetical protein
VVGDRGEAAAAGDRHPEPVWRRRPQGCGAGGGGASGGGGTRHTAGALRPAPPPGPDAPMALWASATGAPQRTRSGPLRLCGLHGLWGAVPAGSLGEGRHDQAGEPQTGQGGPRHRVAAPSAPTGPGAARRAQAARARPRHLLRRQWPLAQAAAARRSAAAGGVPMAVPSPPAHPLAREEVWRLAPAVASPPPTDAGPHLGRVATSHLNGRAGGWQSPCPDLARGWEGNLPAYSTTAFWRHQPGGNALPTALAVPPARRGRAARQPGAARLGLGLDMHLRNGQGSASGVSWGADLGKGGGHDCKHAAG